MIKRHAGLRLVLIYLIAFGAGAVGMGFEILGSRVLAPYFGTSVFVWGALIGVFMAGLSAGYALGGILADRTCARSVYGLLLLVPGLMLLAFPWYGFGVAEWLGLMDLGPRLGPLLGSAALFFLPTVFLGAVTPFSVRLVLGDPARLGRSVGTLYALSTVGSIVGTLGTAFFLVLWMGTRAGMITLGSVLVALALLTSFVSERADAEPQQGQQA